MQPIRKIIHIDMDAFYASVEQRDRPELKGKPVIVGGDPQSRGVVAACSYEAFLDVTENYMGMKSATLIAREIKQKVYDRTGKLTASAGVSFNKFIAKVASDMNKPDGITVIPPDMADEFMDRLPIRKFFGVGKVTEEKMINLGIKTGAELKKYKKEQLIQLFGKSGSYFFNIAHGNDDRPVEPNRIRKSIGKETTLLEDIDDTNQMLEILDDIAVRLENSLINREAKGRTITLKVKYFDFQSITRSVTIDEPADRASVIMKYLKPLLSKTEAGEKKVRLLGISISNFDDQETNSGKVCKYRQLPLPFKFPNVKNAGNDFKLW